jgi:hypothetical protein
LKAIEKLVVGGKGQGRETDGVEWTKVKYTYSRDTSKTPLNLDL